MNEIAIPPCTECSNNNRLFCGLTLDHRENFSKSKGKNVYKKGQVIFYEGNYPNGLFCIFRGKVKISKIGQEGKEQIIKFAGEGETLGYRALMNEESYNATATAMEDCHICHLSRNAFMRALEANNRLSRNMIELLSNDLKDSERKLMNISQKPVKDRVAESLLILITQFGYKKDGHTLDATLTRREIGEIAGITTETAIRTLSEFNKENLIRLEDKKILILDFDKIKHIANAYGN
ncbi:MAG: Crp/Fnr family transcriptional regulator [Cytophagales bacterium]|nr:Crp/Fnr family transcriptional regulator [Cytophagales bacterium]